MRRESRIKNYKKATLRRLAAMEAARRGVSETTPTACECRVCVATRAAMKEVPK